jgi:hypothetical protein
MKVKDPSLRSCYSHPLLAKIEEDIDDYRDNNGDDITEEEFKKIVSQYQVDVPNESELLYDLAYENFIDTHIQYASFLENTEFEGPSDQDIPEYKSILKDINKECEEMWLAYDKELHKFCRDMYINITDKEKVVKIGTEITLHQLSFDEESSVCLHTILFILKTLVNCKVNSKYQNSVKRAEMWLQEACLM